MRPETVRLADGRFALPCSCGQPMEPHMALVRLQDGPYMIAHMGCLKPVTEDKETPHGPDES